MDAGQFFAGTGTCRRKTPQPARAPGAHGWAEGAPSGWPLFWLLFSGHAEKSNSGADRRSKPLCFLRASRSPDLPPSSRTNDVGGEEEVWNPASGRGEKRVHSCADREPSPRRGFIRPPSPFGKLSPANQRSPRGWIPSACAAPADAWPCSSCCRC